MESCRWCGASVSPKDVLCPRCGARLRRESATCRRCRREIRSGLAVCPNCGEDLLRRRIPWKLIGGLGGVFGAAVLVYLVLTLVPLPFELPFVAAAPTATPTEVILPPTPTATATLRPPTSTPTGTATSSPVITATATVEVTPTRTVTATLTPQVTVTPGASPGLAETPTSTPTEAGGYLYPAPQLRSPADESDMPENQFNFTSADMIVLTWEAVGSLGEKQWYEVSVSYTGRDSTTRTERNWKKETSFEVPQGWHDYIMLGEREVYWNVTVKSGTPGTAESKAISPPSETWMFRWG